MPCDCVFLSRVVRGTPPKSDALHRERAQRTERGGRTWAHTAQALEDSCHRYALRFGNVASSLSDTPVTVF